MDRYDDHPQEVVDTLVSFGSPSTASSASPKRPGRKRDPNTMQNRKVQNRIAQREFRQRKQAYVKELEAKLNYLSQDKNVQDDVMQSYVAALVQENKTLRGVVSTLGSLLGSTASPLVEKAQASFVEYDTENHSYTVGGQTPSNKPGTPTKVVNMMPSPATSTESSKPRIFNNIDDDFIRDPKDCDHECDSMFPDLRTNQALRVICYHVDNAKKAERDGKTYALPGALRPTLLQSTIPHSSMLDYIPHATMRDRLLVHHGSKDPDLRELCTDFIHGFEVVGTGDDMDPSQWEVKRSFVEKYPFLVDDQIITAGNVWRKSRGEKAITLVNGRVVEE